MATLAFGIAGSAIGGVAGAVVSLAGALIGPAIDNLLFPPQKENSPVDDENKVSVSTYGKAVELGYGTDRRGGNTIWIGEIFDDAAGGGGLFGKGGLGGGPAQPVTRRFGSWMMAFGRGPGVNVHRIWFDNKLVYDITGSEEVVKKEGLNFRFRKGEEDQLPDSLVEADKGVGNVSANRGIITIVFDTTDITDNGRIPQVQAEIVFSESDADSIKAGNEITVGEGGIFDGEEMDYGLMVDYTRDRVYWLGLNSTTDDSGIRVAQHSTLQEIRQEGGNAMITGAQNPDALDHPVKGGVGLVTGNLYFDLDSGIKAPIAKVDSTTLRELARFGVSIAGVPGNLTTDFVKLESVLEVGLLGELGGVLQTFLFTGSIFGELGLLDVTLPGQMDFVWLNNDETDDDNRGACAVPPGDAGVGIGVMWMLNTNGTVGAQTINLRKMTIFAGAHWDGTNTQGVQWDTTTILASEYGGRADFEEIRGPWYDQTDGGLIFKAGTNTNDDTYIFKWREGEGVVWTQEVANFQGWAQENLVYWPMNNAVLSGGTFGMLSGDNTPRAMVIDTSDGSVICNNSVNSLTGSLPMNGTAQTQQVYNSRRQSITYLDTDGRLRELFMCKKSSNKVTLASIVTDLSLEAGFNTSEIDVTELTDLVCGYTVGRQMEARQAIEPLRTAYHFDGVESDGVVDFKKRGRASTRTILQEDMVARGGANPVYTESRIQEVELPMRLAIIHNDPDRDYLTGTQTSKRSIFPAPTSFSLNKREISTPVVMDEDQARQLSEVKLFTAWNERVSRDFQANWEHLDLDPADVVDLNLDGVTVKARIANTTVDIDLSMLISTVTEDSVLLTSTVLGDGGAGVPPQTLPQGVATKLFIFDVPSLRDVDVPLNFSRPYVAMSGFVEGWNGGVLWDSPDNTVYAPVVGVPNPITWGIMGSTLPNTATPFQTDETTTLTLFPQVGTLASVSQTQFLDLENVLLIGDPVAANWEIVPFRDVSLVNGRYEVTHLTRGRRGTDIHVGSHGASEFWVYLNRSMLEAFPLTTGQLNVLRYYRGVANGVIVEDADISTLTHVGADLKPYAPVLLEAVLDGSNNIDFNWVRRTRSGGAWQDQFGTVPLSEATEDYEVDILDGPGGAVVRTIDTTPSANGSVVTPGTQSAFYDTIDIVADLGMTPTSIDFIVYQMSSVVNRGFGREGNITL